ncbi:MAG: hypothetical protein KatS3mg054_0236 [Chloroflexus sp.]|nr:MAG: hypothetical protein KatS3mg054_0236 [Chloroflexus sp.]
MEVKVKNANIAVGLSWHLAEKAEGTIWENAAYKAARAIEDWSNKGWPRISVTASGTYVPSSDGRGLYLVSKGEKDCSCQAFKAGKKCWHRAAARMIQRMLEAGAVELELANMTEELFVD